MPKNKLPIKKADQPKDESIPRFVLSLTDTQTEITGPKGKQYYNISIAADELVDFFKRSPDAKGKQKTEIQLMFAFFGEQVKNMGENSDFTRITVPKKRNEETK